jgi:uncharacterized protein
MTLVKLATGLALVYLLLVVLVALAQDRLLFPRWATGPGPSALPASAERIELATPDGHTLVGLVLTPVEPPPPDATLILGFGGNAWNAEALALYLHTLLPDRAVAAFHYRGYRPSSGSPSAEALLEDALLVHDHLRTAHPDARILAVGLSLGAGPAARLGRERPVAGLVLVTPFDSLENLARHHYRWLPVRLLLRHRMDVLDDLARTAVPVALIAAGGDTIVPPRRTEPLRDAARDIVLDRTIDGVGHNDLYDSPAFRNAIREAVARIERRATSAPPDAG